MFPLNVISDVNWMNNEILCLLENYWHMVSTENVLLNHTILVGFISMFKCSLNAELIEMLTKF